ncbi:MAG TPA: alkaline phosphatase family protein [Candidatus Latescibacteria bacterium]|jgi:hypothetical protein|nr:alkaline phosphatase family protein [Candidatus Latescibacterota bacterium]HJP33608.1 alkaline phosphatase family protein [Candidatus Latescibacterota bacterium]|tara:strand:+ start:312 stop:1502 length:1191 start_codon:yes stop_codon:yes gene_type:complete
MDDQLVLPDYGGGSIVNVAASILEAFGVESPAVPLRTDLLPPGGLVGANGTVLLVLDALGWSQLEAAVASGRVPRLAGLIEAAPLGVQRLTSVFPSTTTAALSSLATACPPAIHGVLGHMLWFEELGAVVNMLTFCPLGTDVPITEELVRRVPTIYERLRAAGVSSTLITDFAFEGTSFTNLLAEGARFAGYGGLSQISYQLEQALAGAEGPAFYSLYWPLIDTLSHFHGPHHGDSPSSACLEEMEFIDLMLGKVADICSRYGCTLAVVADHGQTALRPEAAHSVQGDLKASLNRPPGGGRRALYLSGVDVDRVSADAALAGSLQLAISTDDAIADGWFGGSCDGLSSRIGDTIVLAGEGVQFLYDYGRGTYAHYGCHAGLTSREMHVPLLVVPHV